MTDPFGSYTPPENQVSPPTPSTAPDGNALGSPLPMTDVEKVQVQDLFIKHNHAINMKGFDLDDPNEVKGWWFRSGWWHRFKEWADDRNPFSCYQYVSSADEYINLPWSKRSVWFFWYKDVLITGNGKTIFGSKKDRETVAAFLEYSYPLQYFIRKKGFFIKVRLSQAYDWVKCNLNPRQKWLTKQIPKHWSDKTNLIPLLNFAMVVDFIEGEEALDVTDWEASSEQADQFSKELKDCYDYIKVRRPDLEERLGNSYPDEDTMTGDYYVDYAEHTRLELQLNNEDTKYLTWIVINRDFFWT